MAVASGLFVWGFREFDRNATIPLIDRNDPAHADALFHLDRRAMTTLTGRPNRPMEELSPERLKIVQQLSRARLSQAVYESSIARVDHRPSPGARIKIPSYRWAGWKLERQVRRECGHRDAADQWPRIRTFFSGFGARRQELTVTTRLEQIDGQPLVVYTIQHDFKTWGTTRMTLGSTLPASHLVLYAPFQRWFPAVQEQPAGELRAGLPQAY